MATNNSENEALRQFLLMLLTDMPREMLTTPEGREEVAVAYERQSVTSHAAVAKVLRMAADTVRGMRK